MSKQAKDTSLGAEPGALRDQLDRLADALEEMAKADGAEAMKAAGDAARRMARQASQLVDELGAAAETAATAAGKGRGQLEDAIRERPLTAIAIAAVAGFLLARLVRR